MNSAMAYLSKTGVLALCSGATVYIYHTRYSRGKLLAQHIEDAQVLTTEVCPPGKPVGKAKVPECSAREGPLVLQLQQVQVMFRHGARTPLHLTPKLSEATYDSEFIMLGHQESMFPFIRVNRCGGRIRAWSKLETNLKKRPLLGGSYCGQLTSYGKEQMHVLGVELGEAYKTRLDLWTYDPEKVRVMSSNIRRTIESAQCFLAGFFGKFHLIDYAHYCGPVKIFTPDPCYNILVPMADSCSVLKKTNYSATVNPDCIQGYKDQRLEVEEHLMKPRDSRLETIQEIQAKIDHVMEFYENEGARSCSLEFNKHHQHYQHNPVFQPLYDERAEAIEKLDRFWVNVISREPSLQDTITTGDVRALNYLRNIRVEQFQGTITSGYRIHLYFDPNPFFWNSHLCKEVFTNENCPIDSKETEIRWKEGMRHFVQSEFKEATCPDREEKFKCKPSKCSTPIPTCPEPVDPPEEKEVEVTGEDSFFAWFINPTSCDSDSVGAAIMADVWRKPLEVMENERKVSDPWDKKFNSIYCLDDCVSRKTHGWCFPAELKKFQKMIEKTATENIFYTLTSQIPEARKTVTRLSAGPLLTEVIDTARDLMCGGKSPKLCLYSTHDGTLVAMLEALCLWDNKWPPFASNLVLELYKDVNSSDYYVRLLYNGKEARVRGQCESFMHWMEFCSSVKKYTIRKEEFEKICCSNILECIAEETRKSFLKKPESETPEPEPCP